MFVRRGEFAQIVKYYDEKYTGIIDDGMNNKIGHERLRKEKKANL